VLVELTSLVVVNVAYAVVGVAVFVAAGWVSPANRATWSRLGAAYLFGLVVLVIPASYLVLLGVPVGLTAVVVGAVAVLVAARRIWGSARPTWPKLRPSGLDTYGGAAITLGTLVLLCLALRTFAIRPLVEFDAWAIWASKARLLYQDPGIAAAVLRTGRYGQAPYPLGLPTIQALGFGAMGRFDGAAVGVQFLGLAFGYVAALWSLLVGRARPAAIALAAACVVIAPEILFQLMTHYADVPLGLFVGLGVAAAAAWTMRPDADNWLLACAAAFLGMAGLTKSEGALFAAAAAVALVATQAGPAWRGRIRPALVAAAALAAIVLPWSIYCAAYGLSTADYDLANVVDVPYLRAHSDRVGPVVSELGNQLVQWNNWGLLVPAVGAAVVTALVARRWRVAGFAVLWLALAFGGLVLIYWVSTLPTTSNLTNSSFRTIVSLIVGGVALTPLLIAPLAEDASGDATAEQRPQHAKAVDGRELLP
jgi:hypothetical protein